MSNTMFTTVHPDEDRFLNAREMMHLMGLPHDFEIDSVKDVKVTHCRECSCSHCQRLG
jgi:site-specific DNA-cytosine methylase